MSAESERALSLILDARRVRRAGRPRSIAEMVAFARAESPYYRALYQGLLERRKNASMLPVTSKRELVSRFDDWCTDRGVTLDKARRFHRNPPARLTRGATNRAF